MSHHPIPALEERQSQCNLRFGEGRKPLVIFYTQIAKTHFILWQKLFGNCPGAKLSLKTSDAYTSSLQLSNSTSGVRLHLFISVVCARRSPREPEEAWCYISTSSESASSQTLVEHSPQPPRFPRGQRDFLALASGRIESSLEPLWTAQRTLPAMERGKRESS